MNSDESGMETNLDGNLLDAISYNDRTNMDESIIGNRDALDKTQIRSSFSNNSKNNIVIYLYKFSEYFMNQLYIFSKIHQYDTREDFKESWKIWIEENEDSVQNEIRRLCFLHYEGDVIDKMFKSARYYFRKKRNEKKEQMPRKKYIHSNKDFLDAIDKHIGMNIHTPEYKPANAFEDFCKKNIDILREEIQRVKENNLCSMTVEEISKRFKKIYNNRYFIFVTK